MTRHPGVRAVAPRRARLKLLRDSGAPAALVEWRTERATAAHSGFPVVPVLLSGSGRRVMVWAIERRGDAVHVWTDRARSDGGHLVVVNPPTLVEDPTGDIVVRGTRHREDAGQALVEIVLAEMGAPAPAGRYRARGGVPQESPAPVDPSRYLDDAAGGQPT